MKAKCNFRAIMSMLILWFCSNVFGSSSSVVFIHNGNTEVGILPDVGGRIVVLRQIGHENLLKASPELWDESASERPVPDAKRPLMKSYYGQIVWVGPQSDWWIQQDENPKLRDENAQWPPDPFLIYGNHQIMSQTDSLIVMQGPDSPVSGLRLIKAIMIDPQGKVHFKVTGQNIRNESVKWDLWCNFRTSGLNQCYVPVAKASDVRVDNEQFQDKTIPYDILDGYFTFLPQVHAKGRKSSKAFIQPKSGWIAGFQQDQLLIIRFEKIERSQIHPNQGHVEIYLDVGKDSASLMELEHHAVYHNLEPGETMSTEEIWEIIPYSGDETPEAQVMFLESLQESD